MTADKDIDSTINSLCSELKPVKCLCPWKRSALLMVLAASYTFAMIMMVGFRPHVMDKMFDQAFIFEIGLALATAMSATIATFCLTLPDSQRYNMFLGVPMTLFGVMIFWMSDRLFMEGFGPTPERWFTGCWIDCMLMTGLPAALVVFLVRKGASVRPFLLAFNAVLAVSIFGWIGIRFTCPYDSVGKAYFVNFMPFVVIGLVAGLFAKRLFRW